MRCTASLGKESGDDYDRKDPNWTVCPSPDVILRGAGFNSPNVI